MANCKWRMANESRPGLAGAAGFVLSVVIALTLAGCTRESVRIALESQQRANQVQQTVFEHQHEGLRMLL